MPGQDSDGSSWRAPGIVAAIMIGWMLVSLALASFSTTSGSAGEGAIQLGRGVTVTPSPGWLSATDVWKVGPNAVSLKKAGSVVVFAAEAYGGTTEELLALELVDLEAQFDSYGSLPAAQSTVAGGLPALAVLFSGTAKSSRLEGELVVATHGGTGMVMLAMAPAGQLPRIQADIDTMLQTLGIPR